MLSLSAEYAAGTAHGVQPQRVVLAAAQRPAVELALQGSLAAAANGMSYALERGIERKAVTDERLRCATFSTHDGRGTIAGDTRWVRAAG